MQNVLASADDDLADFKPRSVWYREAENIRGILSSEGSAIWFIRQHRDRLEREGVLIRRRGPAGDLVNTRRIGQIALQIMREESAAT